MQFRGVRRFLLIAAFFCSAAMLTPVQAQYSQAPNPSDTYGPSHDWDDDIPAHISFVDGSVTLEREGKFEPAEANLALLAGDRLRTRGGRVEVLFADGSALYLDENTELDLLDDSLVRLTTGRLRLSITRTTSNLDYRVDAPAASVWIQNAGEYRVDLSDRRGESEVDLTVIRGSAELVNEHGRTLVRPGTHAVATANLAPSLPYVTNTSNSDDFDYWMDRQRSARVGTYSTQYLPADLRYYSGAFDAYGSWDYMPAYGYVWYPRVSTGWRPYSQGRWSFSAHFGWLWVGIDRWSWPTHHYGRWGVSSGTWYWIPDRRWSPAWVSWGTAPGYVSWCPLGYNGRAVYSFGYSDPWFAWTVMPSRYFAPNVWVTQHVVVYNTISPGIRTQFVERAGAPITPAYASPRVAPIHAPTSSRATAVPRNGGPAYPGQESWRNRATSSASVQRGSIDDRGAVNRSTARYGTAQPDGDPARAVPTDRSRQAAGVSRADVPRVQSPRVDVPRASVPERPSVSPVESPRAAARTRPADPRPDEQPARTETSSRAAARARPDEAPARPDPSSRAAARARPESGAQESRPSWSSQRSEPERAAPAQRSEPDRGPSRMPERSAPRESSPRYGSEPSRPSSPPPPRTEPDRPSRAPERASPPPSSSTPPPSQGRGRGGDDSKAVPHRRGGKE